MAWNVRASEEFVAWWESLDADTQEELGVLIELLRMDGPALPRPYADKVRGSRIDLRELRKTVYDRSKRRQVLRVLYAFDPNRNVLLCLGGDKGGDDRWYERSIPRAEAIFERYVTRLKDKDDG